MSKELTLKEHLQRIASAGGIASAKALTKEQRKLRAKRASAARKRL